jgi:hypothetical protein
VLSEQILNATPRSAGGTRSTDLSAITAQASPSPGIGGLDSFLATTHGYSSEYASEGDAAAFTRKQKRGFSPSSGSAAISRLANFARQSYAPSMAGARATLLMWFYLRSPELAEDFERLMASDRDIVGGSLDTMQDWRLTRPMDVPGQAGESADYVLIAEIVNIERWQQQAEQRVEGLADDLAHLVSSRKMLVLQRIL